MKLNPDCIRDILLEVEEVTSLDCRFSCRADVPETGRLAVYPFETLAYHIKQCDLNGYFAETITYDIQKFEISYLSPKGHAFLSDIRSDTVWKHTKTVAGRIGAWSLDTLSKIAIGVVTELIKSYVGIPSQTAPYSSGAHNS